MRADSGFYAAEVVAVCRKTNVRFSITLRMYGTMRTRIAAIPEEAWTPIPYWIDGGADVAEITYIPFADRRDAKPVRLIVRRVKPTPGSQLAFFTLYDYHAFITDRVGEMLELEADHRRHAEIENAIRDLKYGMGLNHLPSGKFAANAAWLAVQVMAHCPLDGPDRSGGRDRHDQDASAAAVRPRRAAHPECATHHPPLPGALALGRRVRGRPREVPGDPAPRLTVPPLLRRSGGRRQRVKKLPAAGPRSCGSQFRASLNRRSLGAAIIRGRRRLTRALPGLVRWSVGPVRWIRG